MTSEFILYHQHLIYTPEQGSCESICPQCFQYSKYQFNLNVCGIHHFHQPLNKCCQCQSQVIITTKDAPNLKEALIKFRDSVTVQQYIKGLDLLIKYLRDPEPRPIKSTNLVFRECVGDVPYLMEALGYSLDGDGYWSSTDRQEVKFLELELYFALKREPTTEIRYSQPQVNFQDAVPMLLKMIGSQMTSIKIKEPYKVLGCVVGQPEDEISFIYQMLVRENPQNIETYLEALRQIVDDYPQSVLLDKMVGPAKDMSVDEAYLILQADRSVDDDTLLAAYQFQIVDSPARKHHLQQAIKTIAQSKHSDLLVAFCIEEGLIEAKLFNEPEKVVYNRFMPVGIKNIGNTCYFNSLLQFLYTINDLRSDILNYAGDGQFQLHMSVLFKQLKSSHDVTVTIPEEFGKMALKDNLNFFDQQDLVECLEHILQQLGPKYEQMFSMSVLCTYKFMNDQKKVQTETKEESLRSIMVNANFDHVELALQAYFRQSSVELQQRFAQQNVVLRSLPPILVVYIKRAQYDVEKQKPYKDNHVMNYSDQLDMKMFYQGSQDTKYQLHAVIIHNGNVDSGHYYLCMKQDDQWFKYNDSVVEHTDPYKPSEGSANPCCLIYVKQGTVQTICRD